MNRLSRYRLPLILALLITLPLILLGWQGYQALYNDHKIQQNQFDQLVRLELDKTNALINQYFDQQMVKWNRLVSGLSADPSELQVLTANTPEINHIFIIDHQKQRIFPADQQQHSKHTQTFIERLQPIWNDPESLMSHQRQYQNQENSPPKRRFKKAQASTRMSGWYSWHWRSTTHIIYWQQRNDASIVGIELNDSHIMADIIALLPDTSKQSTPSFQTQFTQQLLDTHGHIIYEWGTYKHKKQSPLQSTMLNYPLSSWKLNYYAPRYTPQSIGIWGLLLLLATFALALGGLAYYLYREHNRELREAEQRVNFVSQVSHELKTPLTNIRMYAEMLEDNLDDDPLQQRYSHIIVSESQRLTRLINNVLNFSREPRNHLQWFQPETIVHQTIEYFLPGFTQKDITIHLSLDNKDEIYADKDALDQIVNNLLSNVEKYASKGQRVDIATQLQINSKNEKVFILRIRDYGSGISAREQQQIFKPFYRVNNQVTEGVSGTGIGLTIAQQQAQRMGGKLMYCDVSPGACFELQLPVPEKQT